MAFLGKIGKTISGALSHPLQTLGPIAGGLIGTALLPGVGTALGLGAGASAALGAGLGSAAGSLATGGGLKGALLSGGTAGLTEGLTGGLSSANRAIGNFASSAGESLGLSGAPSAAASSNLAAGADLLPQAENGLAQVPNINLAAQGGELIPSGGGLTTGSGNLTGSGLTAGLTGGDAAVAASGGTPGFGDKLLSGLKGIPGKALDSITSNPIQAALGATSLLNQNSVAKQIGQQEQALQAQAAQTQAQVAPLLNSLTSGQLPAGAQGLIDQQTQAEISQIRSKYAQMGLSGSTMEQQEISGAHERAQSQVFTIAQQMASTGLQALGASSGISQNLLNTLLEEDKAAASSIGNLGSALAGGGKQAAA